MVQADLINYEDTCTRVHGRHTTKMTKSQFSVRKCKFIGADPLKWKEVERTKPYFLSDFVYK